MVTIYSITWAWYWPIDRTFSHETNMAGLWSNHYQIMIKTNIWRFHSKTAVRLSIWHHQIIERDRNLLVILSFPAFQTKHLYAQTQMHALCWFPRTASIGPSLSCFKQVTAQAELTNCREVWTLRRSRQLLSPYRTALNQNNCFQKKKNEHSKVLWIKG